MFHLDPGIHFNKVEVALGVEQKLNRPDIGIADRLGGLDRHGAHPFAQAFGQGRRGRFLNEFLIAALDRTLALPEMNDVAVLVAHDLKLDMPGALQVFLDV